MLRLGWPRRLAAPAQLPGGIAPGKTILRLGGQHQLAVSAQLPEAHYKASSICASAAGAASGCPRSCMEAHSHTHNVVM